MSKIMLKTPVIVVNTVRCGDMPYRYLYVLNPVAIASQLYWNS